MRGTWASEQDHHGTETFTAIQRRRYDEVVIAAWNCRTPRVRQVHTLGRAAQKAEAVMWGSHRGPWPEVWLQGLQQLPA